MKEKTRLDMIEERLSRLECDHKPHIVVRFYKDWLRGDYVATCDLCQKTLQRFSTEKEYLAAKIDRDTQRYYDIKAGL